MIKAQKITVTMNKRFRIHHRFQLEKCNKDQSIRGQPTHPRIQIDNQNPKTTKMNLTESITKNKNSTETQRKRKGDFGRNYVKGIKNKGLGITEARIFSKMKNGFR